MIARLVSAAAVLGLAGVLVATDSIALMAVLLGAGLVFHLSLAVRWRTGLLALWPIVSFAGILLLLGWLGGGASGTLALKTIGVFLLVVSGARLPPWSRLAAHLRLGTRTGAAVLTALMVRHFVIVLTQEARRLLVAYRLAVPRRYGPGWFRALTWALAGLFRRSLARAERFYAAQLVRGLGQ